MSTCIVTTQSEGHKALGTIQLALPGALPLRGLGQGTHCPASRALPPPDGWLHFMPNKVMCAPRDYGEGSVSLFCFFWQEAGFGFKISIPS